MLQFLPMFFLLILLDIGIRISGQDYNDDSLKNVLRRSVRDAPYCSYRCSRIYQRSLSGMNENLESVQYLFERLEPVEDIRDACWKSYDFLDCMEHCELQSRQRLAVIRNVIKDRCRNFMEGNETNLACISKYHTFVEVRCSTYLSEAIHHMKNEHRDSMLQICRYMYYHSLCLVNTMNIYCPDAAHQFTHTNLRNYFLSFLLPADDRQFSDDLLDECRVYQFAKISKAPIKLLKNDETPTAPTVSTKVDRILVTHPDVQLISTTKETPTGKEESTTKTKATFKKLFSPDDDLIDAPPNFFYSSLRSMSLGRKPSRKDAHSKERSESDDVDFITNSDAHKEITSAEYTSEVMDNSSLENIHKAEHIDVSDSETTTATPITITTTDDVFIWSYESYNQRFPIFPAAATVSFSPITTGGTTTGTSTTVITELPTVTPKTTKLIVEKSRPAYNKPSEPTKPAIENYTIRRPTLQKPSSEEIVKTLPKKRADEVEIVKTLPTDLTGDEYFEHLTNQDEMIEPLLIKSFRMKQLIMEPIKISRPEDGITIEIAPSGDVIYVHNSDQQASDQVNSDIPMTTATTPTASLHDITTTISTTNKPLPSLSMILTTATVPQSTSHFPTSTSPFSSEAAPDFADLLDQIDIQANVPNSGESSGDTNTMLRPTKILQPLNVLQKIPKTKTYKVFPLPTTTTQVLMPESDKQQTTTLNPASLSSEELLHDANQMLKASLKIATTLGTTSSMNVHKENAHIRPIVTFDDYSTHEVRQNETMKKSEIMQPASSGTDNKTVTSANSAEPEMDETMDVYNLFFIYEILVFVAFLAALILLLTSITLKNGIEIP